MTGQERQLAKLTDEVMQLRALVQQLLANQAVAAPPVSTEQKISALKGRGVRLSDHLKQSGGRL